MILKKPYAFIIKHFKLLHLILTALLSLTIYRLVLIMTFLKEYLVNPVVFDKFSVESYLSSNDILRNIDSLDSLFPLLAFIIPLIIIIISLIILFILYNKRKPFLLYIFTIVFSLVLFILYGISYNLTYSMRTVLVDIRLTNMIKDIYTIIIIIGSVLALFALIRATGFDIKKFNFVKDLQELDISEEDSEEFEVELNVDSNVLRRNFRKKLRTFKYNYVEKKFLINLIVLLVLLFAGFIIYFFIIVHHKEYSQNQTFSTDNFDMQVENVYITNKDYKNNIITDNYLVVVDLKIKSYTSKGKVFDVGNSNLIIGEKEYKHDTKYRDLLFDLGVVYDNNLIYNVESKYLLVYEIPKESINKQMIFRYTLGFDILASTLKPIYANVKLNPINLNTNLENKNYSINDEIIIDSSIMRDSKIQLTGYDLNSTMAEYYRFCISTKECYDSVEYINPSIGNEEKTLLKIEGKVDNIKIKNVYDLYNLIEKFGKIKYRINGFMKRVNVYGKVNPVHSSKDTYYLEIPKEVEQADMLSLEFNIRNIKYEYVLK